MGLAKPVNVSKVITYKAITVAIGILVAVVIAFTLWVRTPRETTAPGAPTAPQSMLNTARSLLKAVTSTAVNAWN